MAANLAFVVACPLSYECCCEPRLKNKPRRLEVKHVLWTITVLKLDSLPWGHVWGSRCVLLGCISRTIAIPQKKHRHGFLHGAFEVKDEGNLFHYFIRIWLSIFFQMGGDYRPTRLKPNCGSPVAKNRQGVQWNEDRWRTDWITWWIHHRLMILMVWMVASFTGQYRSRFRYHYIYCTHFRVEKLNTTPKCITMFPLLLHCFGFVLPSLHLTHPLKIGVPSQKEIYLPTIDFKGRKC